MLSSGGAALCTGIFGFLAEFSRNALAKTPAMTKPHDRASARYNRRAFLRRFAGAATLAAGGL